MSTFLHKIAPDLAIGAVVTPLASYGIHRIFPAPDAGFLAVATMVSVCVAIAIRDWGTQYAYDLTRDYGYVNRDNRTTNFIFHRLNQISHIGVHILLPIFARAVGQRMGFQVPGYLQAVAYFSLASGAYLASKNIFEILRDAYFQGGFITPPARK